MARIPSKLKITTEELGWIRDHVCRSVEKKTARLHTLWRDNCKEYRLSNASYWDFYESMVEEVTGDVPQRAAVAVTGKGAHINVLARKFKALLSLRHPDFTVDAGDPGQEPLAWLLEKAWDNLQDQIKFPRMTRRMLLEGALTGNAVVMTGYRSEFGYGETPLADRVPSDAAEDEEQDAMDKPGVDVTEYADLTVVNGGPFAKLLRPYDVFYDLQARTCEEVRWVFRRASRIVRDVQRDIRYLEEAREQVTGIRPTDSDEDGRDIDWEIEDELRRVDVWEVYNLATGYYMAYADGVNDVPLRHWTYYAAPNQSPFIHWSPVPDPESPWGLPWVSIFAPQVHARDTITARIVDSISRHGKTVNVVGSEWSQETINKINDSTTDTIVRDDNLTTEQLRVGAPVLVELGKVDPEVYQLREMIEADLNQFTGLSDPTMNVYRNREQTATEVANRVQGQVVTLDDIRTEYEEAVEDIAAAVFRIMLEEWDDTQIVRYVGENPMHLFWTRVARDKVLGNFMLKVRVGSTQKISPEVRSRQLIDLSDRILKFDEAIFNQKMREQQTQIPSTVNLEEYLRCLLDGIDPLIADKITNRRDPVVLIQRLVRQQLADPVFVAPELLQQLAIRDPELAARLGSNQNTPVAPPPMMPPMGAPMPAPMGPPMGGGNVVPFEVENRIPGQPEIGPQGQIPMDTAAGVQGRALSEGFGGLNGP